MMPSFMYHLDHEVPRYLAEHYWGVSVKVFLDEISI